MTWYKFSEMEYPKERSFVATHDIEYKTLCLCTQIGDELHITDDEQWQYIFQNDEVLEIRGNVLKYWLAID